MDRRSTLLAIGAIASVIILVLAAALHDRRVRSDRLQEERAAENAAHVAQAIDGIDATQAAVVQRLARTIGIELRQVGGVDVPSRADTSFTRRMRASMAAPGVAVVGELPCEHLHGPERADCHAVHVITRGGIQYLLTVREPADVVAPLPLYHLALYVALLCLLMSLLTFVIARHSMRPLRRLAEAAAKLGDDIEGANVEAAQLAEEGTGLARQAATAFNTMQSRIRAQMQHRTHMLSAITHDLQTPLTRVRLRVEKVEDEQLRAKLIDDLAMVQSMVRSGLELARSMESNEPRHLLDLDSMIDSVVADALDAGHDVQAEGRSEAFVMAQATQLRRCVTNLVDNAAKYGRRARIGIAVEGDSVALAIRDDGPGIPEDQLEAVFEPFYRMEPSRSRETGGTGLGLTIARNIARNHGGRLTLRNRAEGGLEAMLVLPVRRFRS